MAYDHRSFYLAANPIRQDTSAFVGTIPAGLQTKEALLQAVAKALKFPDYFGHNFDALQDCLRDLSWIAADHIILSHEDLPALPHAQRGVYLDVLAACLGPLDDRADGKRLTIAFPLRYRKALSQHE